MNRMIDKEKCKQELLSLNNYLRERKLTIGEVSLLLNMRLDEDIFITAIRGVERLKKNHSL